MEIISWSSAKGVAAIALVALGGTGIYLTSSHFTTSLSEHDRALIDFLEDDGNDIIFEVKKGDKGDQDLDVNDIVFSESKPAPVTAKVKVVADVSKLKTTFIKGNNNGEAGKLEIIQNLGGKNKTWTWECSFTFGVDGEDSKGKTIKEDYKNRIWKHPDLGLFGLLKKKISDITNSADTNSNSWTKDEVKKVKVDFIEKCGQYRHNNRKESPEAQDEGNVSIKFGDISIIFRKIQSEDKLEPKDQEMFNHWFIGEKDKDKTYAAAPSSG